MDLLSRINAAYSSSDSDDENDSKVKPGDMIKSSAIAIAKPAAVSLAPEVDVSDLQAEKEHRELTRFETTNNLIKKQNHLNGVVEQIHINPAKFHE